MPKIRPTSDMLPQDAEACAKELRDFLTSRGIWYNVTEIHESGLRFIKLEVSIKIKN